MEENIYYHTFGSTWIRLNNKWYTRLLEAGEYNWMQIAYVPNAYEPYKSLFKPLTPELLSKLMADMLQGKVRISNWIPES